VTANGWQTLRLDELEPILAAGVNWKPLRRTLGIEAFGTNAYVAGPGEDVVEEHSEERLGHEEVYVVVSGRATFTLDGDAHDAPAGTIVHVADASVRRYARAEEPNTTVLAIGGKPGEAYTPSAWEWYFEAERFRPTMDPEIGDTLLAKPEPRDADAALALLDEALERFPDHIGVLFSIACWQALAGRDDEALETLRRAAAIEPRIREWAANDDDLASVRDRLLEI
jgi:mannose-6-phosphate isomerase-like protein (cupin superfamily)